MLDSSILIGRCCITYAGILSAPLCSVMFCCAVLDKVHTNLAEYGMIKLGNYSVYIGVYEEHMIQSHLLGLKGYQDQHNIDTHIHFG